MGDSYYGSTQFLPPSTPHLYANIHSPDHEIDTRVTWGLNLGQNNITAAFLEAKSIVKAFSSPAIKRAGIVLDSIEIGNEANLYPSNGARPMTYTTSQYVKE